MAEKLLEIKDLHAVIAKNNRAIIKGLDLNINAGEVHAIMGPNGAGKSTLANVLTGKADYEIISGEIIFCGKNLRELNTAERAAEGLFLSMQTPIEIPGVAVNNFLKHAINAQRRYRGEPELDAAQFLKLLKEAAQKLEIGSDMLKRELNVGFSGGEKKRLEILQMSILQPKLTILDEADSGLDIDALKIVSQGVNNWHNENNSLLIITHHLDLLQQIKPDFVHIYVDGKIVKTGDIDLAQRLEQGGYKAFLEE